MTGSESRVGYRGTAGIALAAILAAATAAVACAGRVRGGRPSRCWLLAGACGGALVLTLAAAGCSPASPHPGAPGNVAGQAGAVWVCRPGQKADPCVSDLAATTVSVSGALKPATWPHSPAPSKFACFYVHGSDGLTGIGNTSLTVTKVDIAVAAGQAAPLSQVCDVWAPAYRSQTLPTVEKVLAGDAALQRSTFPAAASSSAVLPIPASPASTSAPARPDRIPSTSRPTAASSLSLPYSTSSPSCCILLRSTWHGHRTHSQPSPWS